MTGTFAPLFTLMLRDSLMILVDDESGFGLRALGETFVLGASTLDRSRSLSGLIIVFDCVVWCGGLYVP